MFLSFPPHFPHISLVCDTAHRHALADDINRLTHRRAPAHRRVRHAARAEERPAAGASPGRRGGALPGERNGSIEPFLAAVAGAGPRDLSERHANVPRRGSAGDLFSLTFRSLSPAFCDRFLVPNGQMEPETGHAAATTLASSPSAKAAAAELAVGERFGSIAASINAALILGPLLGSYMLQTYGPTVATTSNHPLLVIYEQTLHRYLTDCL